MNKLATGAMTAFAVLALTGCGGSQNASEDATADTVEMPAEEAMSDATGMPSTMATDTAGGMTSGMPGDVSSDAGTAPSSSAAM